MRKLLLTSFAILVLGTRSALAFVNVDIDLSRQRMHVEASQVSYDWPISSARAGYYTPGGTFSPQRLELMHYSKTYDNAPMPHAIFFSGGFAIHGTYATGALGRPASHGCVRLAPGNAAALYKMVQKEGGRISIHGAPPVTKVTAARSAPRRRAGYAYDPREAGYYGYSAPRSRNPYAYAPSYAYGAPVAINQPAGYFGY